MTVFNVDNVTLFDSTQRKNVTLLWTRPANLATFFVEFQVSLRYTYFFHLHNVLILRMAVLPFYADNIISVFTFYLITVVTLETRQKKWPNRWVESIIVSHFFLGRVK